MYVIIWEYAINPALRRDFINYYNATGKWVSLFATSKDYLGTEFYQSEKSGDIFITIDKWKSCDAYEAFLKAHKEAYAELDAQCERFTVSETLIGKYADQNSV